MIENNAEHFRRIAKERVDDIIHEMRLLGGCSDKILYTYSSEQVEQIFSALQAELDKTKRRFMPEKSKPAPLPGGTYANERTAEPPSIELAMPDGSRLRASAADDEQYPAINIYWEQEDGVSVPICFAEYNPEHSGHELHIGAYQSESDEVEYYAPYEKKGRKI